MSVLRQSRRLLGRIRRAAARIADCLVPRRCAGCRRWLPSDRSTFCPLCAPTVEPLDGPGCPTCARPRPPTGPGAADGVDAICHRCLERRPDQDLASARWRYAGALADALQAAKYRDELWRLEALSRRLAPWLDRLHGRLAATWETDAPTFCPVPAHPSSVRRRGSYPTALLLRLAARRANLPVCWQAMGKTESTAPQAGLPRDERRENIRGVFAADPDAVDDRCWILFDDVLTTGATASEAAAALVEAGARRVAVAVAARAVDAPPG